jgi:hypothetical protein
MVAMNVWPTDGADGSVATEARWRKMGRHWAPNGVAPGIGGELAPTLAGTNLTIKNGAAWVDGHFCELAGDQVLTVTANGLAVVRFDPAANTAELVYRDGVTSPAQSLTGVWEMAVAQIVGSALVDRRGSVTITRDVTIKNATFDANGLFTLTAAMVGLSTIDGVIWGWFNATNNPTGQATQIVAGQAYRASATSFVLTGYAFVHPGGTMSRIGGGTFTELYVSAWGKPPLPGAALFGPQAETRPAGELEPEPEG